MRHSIYDRIGQLQIADSSDNAEDRGYSYDTAWNLSYRTNAGTLQTFTVDPKNQLTNSTPGGDSGFDGNGNTLSTSATPRYFGYDDENQLIAITNSPEGFQPKRTTLTYDGKLRLRLRREYDWEAGGGDDESFAGPGGSIQSLTDGSWVLTSETRYLYDGNRVFQERDTNNTPTLSYTRGTDLSATMEGAGGIGGLLARSHGNSSGNWTTHNYYHADGNGNVTYLVDASQDLAASYRYDPFGRTITSSGSLASANVYRFSSKEQHNLTGMYYYLYRWYEPNLQRWLNRDPIGELGGINLFGFVENNPVDLVDALGLSPEDIQKVYQQFAESFNRLNAEGKRRNGDLFNPELNNIFSPFMGYLGCGKQASEVVKDVYPTLSSLKDKWTWDIPRVWKPLPYQYVELKSKNPSDPIVILDPHKGYMQTVYADGSGNRWTMIPPRPSPPPKRK